MLLVTILVVGVSLMFFYFQYSHSKSITLIATSTFGKRGKDIGEFEKSVTSMTAHNDHLFVADSGNDRIQVLWINSDGGLFPKSVFGKEGNRSGEFQGSLGIAIKDDYLFVADSKNNHIQVLRINPDGSLSPKSAFGKEGNRLGEFDGLPILNLIAKDNYLYAADSGNNRIQVLRINPDGSLSPKSAFGKEGNRLGEFGRFSHPMLNTPAPLSLVVKDEYLFVADSANHRIQVLRINPDGSLSPKSAIGKNGNRLGEFQGPFGLAIKDDYLFVADSANHRIQVLRIHSNGRLSPQFAFGTKGKALGEFGNYLTALSVVGNYLYVSDTGNDRIQVLEIKY